MPKQEDIFSIQMTLGGCQFCEEVGSSALGTIYRVVHPDFGQCALKFLEHQDGKKQRLLQSFLERVIKARETVDRHLATIYEVSLEAPFFILRELVLGESLADRLKRGRLPVEEATRILYHSVLSLQATAALDILHKNIKPSNILITPAGIVKLVDGSLPPTLPDYLSPEQCAKLKSDIRSDFYSLGVVYYEMLTGNPPFTGDHGEQIVQQHLSQPVPSLTNRVEKLPRPVVQIVETLLEKDVEKRYPDFAAFLHVLEKVLKMFGVDARAEDLEPEEEAVVVTGKEVVISADLLTREGASVTAKKEEILPVEAQSQKTAEPPMTCPEALTSGPARIAEAGEGVALATTTTTDGRSLEEKLLSGMDDAPPPQVAAGERPMHTSMMVGFTRENSHDQNQDTRRIEVSERPTLRIEAGAVDKAVLQAEQTVKSELEEFFLTQRALEEDWDKVIFRVAYIEPVKERKKPLPPRRICFPRQFEKRLVEHLFKTFRRECWLLKQTENPLEMEIALDVEEAHVLRHFYYYEDRLQEALGRLQSEGTTQASAGETPVEQERTFDLPSEAIVSSPEDSSASPEGAQSSMDRNNRNNRKQQKTENIPSVGAAEDTSDRARESDAQIVAPPVQDITFSTRGTPSSRSKAHQKRTDTVKRMKNQQVTMAVDFSDAYQTMGWVKFLRQHSLKKDRDFFAKQGSKKFGSLEIFAVNLSAFLDFQTKQDSISSIKEFFSGDYEIKELDSGGMGAVFKLTAKNDPTFLSLRPENAWARHHFKPYLKVIKDAQNKEAIYAELPMGMEFVVKIAFEGYEESLIQEAEILNRVAEDPKVSETIIGVVQQGRILAYREEQATEAQIGYYLMLEFAPQGNTEQLYNRFPDGRLTLTVAFAMMYGMVQTLQKLKQKGIIHRDLKPHNILLDTNGVPKLCDFGLSITTDQGEGELTEERRRLLRVLDDKFLHLSRERDQAEDLLAKLHKRQQTQEISPTDGASLNAQIAEVEERLPKLRALEEERAEALKGRYRPISAEELATQGKFEGSIYYAAPEQFETTNVLTPACDVYQLGAVMYTMLTGKRPVSGRTTMDVITAVICGDTPRVTDEVQGNPALQDTGDLIYDMMNHDPLERPTIDEVRERLDQILFEHVLELREEPVWVEPAGLNEETQSRWQKRIELAQQMHKNCLGIIMNTIFKNQDTPELSVEVKKIVFKCPKCGKKLHVYRHMHGKKGNCPKCKKRILVQLQLDDAEVEEETP